jgi:hypothetical protein
LSTPRFQTAAQCARAPRAPAAIACLRRFRTASSLRALQHTTSVRRGTPVFGSHAYSDSPPHIRRHEGSRNSCRAALWHARLRGRAYIDRMPPISCISASDSACTSPKRTRSISRVQCGCYRMDTPAAPPPTKVAHRAPPPTIARSWSFRDPAPEPSWAYRRRATRVRHRRAARSLPPADPQAIGILGDGHMGE